MDIDTLLKVFYTAHQFINIIVSAMLIVTGALLLKTTHRNNTYIFKNVNTVIVIYLLISIITLTIHDIKTLDKPNLMLSFLYEILISLFILTNIYFQLGIYKFLFDGEECVVGICKGGDIVTPVGQIKIAIREEDKIETESDECITERFYNIIKKRKGNNEVD